MIMHCLKDNYDELILESISDSKEETETFGIELFANFNDYKKSGFKVVEIKIVELVDF